MMTCLQISKIIIPRYTIFDQLVLAAKFNSASIELFKISFDLQLYQREREVFPGVKLKIPRNYQSVQLVLSPRILNMRVEGATLKVNLNEASMQDQYEYVFLTQVGKVVVQTHFIELLTLPKIVQCDYEEDEGVIQNQDGCQKWKGVEVRGGKGRKQEDKRWKGEHRRSHGVFTGGREGMYTPQKGIVIEEEEISTEDSRRGQRGSL